MPFDGDMTYWHEPEEAPIQSAWLVIILAILSLWWVIWFVCVFLWELMVA